MKILIITPVYFPGQGGTEQAIYELISHSNRGKEFIVLTIKWNEQYKNYEELNGVKVIRVNYLYIKGLTLFFQYFALILMALKLHKKYRFDLIHLFHIYKVAGPGYILKKLFKFPLIITLCGSDTDSSIYKIPNRHQFIVRMAMNRADIVTAPSKHMASAAQKQGCKQKIEIIPHGSGMHKKNSPINKSVIDSLNIQNKRVVLSVQRLDKVKGLEYLLVAARTVCMQCSDIVFVLVGKGEEEEFLRDYAIELGIQSQVMFTGFIEHDNIPAFYSRADLFVLPSLHEAFGIVYIEAMCFGLPIVTTINGGSTDVINDKIGILVPPRDPVKLSEAIIEALDKKWDREAIKNEAKKYTWDDIVQRYERLYEQIAYKK